MTRTTSKPFVPHPNASGGRAFFLPQPESKMLDAVLKEAGEKSYAQVAITENSGQPSTTARLVLPPVPSVFFVEEK